MPDGRPGNWMLERWLRRTVASPLLESHGVGQGELALIEATRIPSSADARLPEGPARAYTGPHSYRIRTGTG